MTALRRRATAGAMTIALVVVMSSLAASPAAAAASVDPAGTSGTTNISADTAADAPGAAWTTLTGPSLIETAAGDIGNGTLILSVPSGFAFDTSGASVSKSSSGTCGLTVSVTAQSAGSITTTISGGPSTNGNLCTLTWSGIKARPLAKAPSTLPSGSIAPSGTATVAGVSGSTSFGVLVEVGGTPTKLDLFGPSGCKAGTACTTQPTVVVRDAWGNVASSSATVTLALTTKPSGATLSVSTNPLNASNGVAQFSGMSVSTFGVGYVLTATSAGLTSSSATFDATSYGNCGGGVTQKCITSFKVDLNGTGTFATVSNASTSLSVSETLGTVQVQVAYNASGSDGYDVLQAGSPYNANTRFEIGLNTGALDSIYAMFTAEVDPPTFSQNATTGNTVTIRGRPRAVSWLKTGLCVPNSCGGLTTQADVDYGGMFLGNVGGMPPVPPGLSPATVAQMVLFMNNLRGALIATNAQAFDVPTMDTVTGALSFTVAAPHLKLSGAVNTGFFNTYLPDTLLSGYWGIANPAALSPSALGATGKSGGTGISVTTTASRVGLGWLVSASNFNYSSPKFSLAPAPSVSSVSPAIGSISDEIVITGTALTSASSVTFGDTPARFTVFSSTFIRAIAPPRADGATVDVRVTTAGGTSESGRRFLYGVPPEPPSPPPPPPVTTLPPPPPPVTTLPPPPPPPPPPVTTLPATPGTQPIATTLPVQLGSDGMVTAPLTISGGAASMALPAGTLVRSGGLAFGGKLNPPAAVTVAGAESAFDFSPGTPLTFDRAIALSLPVPAGASASDFQPVAVDSAGTLTYFSGAASGMSVTFATFHLSVYALARVTRPAVRASDRAFVGQPGHHAMWSGQSDYVQLAPGQLVDLAVRFRNTGTETWYRGIAGKQADLGSSEPLDNSRDYGLGILVSPLFGTNRYATTDTATVAPGQLATFSMRLRAPAVRGVYQVRVRPVIETVTWMEDEGVFLQITLK